MRLTLGLLVAAAVVCGTAQASQDTDITTRASAAELAAAPSNADVAQQSASTSTTLVESTRIHIPRVSRAPQLRDFLSGTPREAEAIVTEFRQRQPGDGEPVSQRTTTYLSYNDSNLYVVFVCDDIPGGVRGHMAKREEIGDDDLVGIYLDTFHDKRRAYTFEANPLGLQRDGLMSSGQKTDYTFDTVWSADGEITETGYVVWMAIPFRSLRFSSDAIQNWGIAVGRKILRTNEQAYWPYITSRIGGFVNQMATLEQMNGISSGHNVQFTPYGSFTGSRFLDQDSAAFRNQTESRGGMDAKFVIREAATLDVTANPDFSQVESDEPQVTVNQRFEVKFPEKRAFFMDNASYFQTPVNLVYSRRIGDPQVGARLTSKASQWAVGALFANDREQGEKLAPDDALYNDRAGIGILRVERELGSQSSAGVLLTSRDFGPSSNRVYAFDTRLQLSPNWYFTGQAAGSETRRLSGAQSSGAAYSAEIEYGGRHFSHSTKYSDFSPAFRSELGYVKRVDLRAISNSAGYAWYPKQGAIQSFGPSASVSADWDHQGVLQDWYVNPAFSVSLSRQISFDVGHAESYELYDSGFRQENSYVSFYSSLTKWLSSYASYSWGTALNYAPANGIAPFLADSASASAGLTWRPAERFRIDGSYIHTGLSNSGSSPSAGAPSELIFKNDIARLKVNYQFTRALSVRTILDYYALLPNENLIEYSRWKTFTGDVLLTYLIHPGTAFYIGYTHQMENVAIDPTVPSTIRLTTSPSTTGRNLFVKFSYLFRY